MPVSEEVMLLSDWSDENPHQIERALHNATDWYGISTWGFRAREGFESESHFGRYIGHNQFLLVYAGWDYRYRTSMDPESTWFGQINTRNKRGAACLGLSYMLPWFIEMDMRLDHTGIARLTFSREDIPITSRLRLWGMVNSDGEYRAGGRYIITKYIAASTHYDSDMGFGIGMMLTY